MTLTVVNKNAKTGLSVIKRSNPHTGQVYEFQVHVPDDSPLKFHVEAWYATKHEADDHIKMNEAARKIWLNSPYYE